GPVGGRGGEGLGRGARRPSCLGCREDATTASARTTSTGTPHLQAAHWRISSVVPVKWPVMCWRRASAFGATPIDSSQGVRAAICAPLGTRWLAAPLSGRGSQGERWTREAQVASEGSAAPSGRSGNVLGEGLEVVALVEVAEALGRG